MYSSLHLFQYSITDFPQGWQRSAPGGWRQNQLAILPTMQADTAHSNRIHASSYHCKYFSQKCTLNCCTLTKFIPGLQSIITFNTTEIVLVPFDSPANNWHSISTSYEVVYTTTPNNHTKAKAMMLVQHFSITKGLYNSTVTVFESFDVQKTQPNLQSVKNTTVQQKIRTNKIPAVVPTG